MPPWNLATTFPLTFVSCAALGDDSGDEEYVAGKGDESDEIDDDDEEDDDIIEDDDDLGK
jgi:hypothetical protein